MPPHSYQMIDTKVMSIPINNTQQEVGERVMFEPVSSKGSCVKGLGTGLCCYVEVENPVGSREEVSPLGFLKEIWDLQHHPAMLSGCQEVNSFL